MKLSECERRVLGAFGRLFSSLDIPGHSSHAFGNYWELVRELKRCYKVEHLSEIEVSILSDKANIDFQISNFDPEVWKYPNVRKYRKIDLTMPTGSFYPMPVSKPKRKKKRK